MVPLSLTNTLTVPAKLVHPLSVIVTEYTPLIASVAFGLVGVRSDDMKPFGPVHEYVAPPPALGVLKLIVFPTHTGLLLVATGVGGSGVTFKVLEQVF